MKEDISDIKYIFYLPNYNKYSNGINVLWQAAYYFSKYRNVSIVITDDMAYDKSHDRLIPDKFSSILIYSQNYNSLNIGSDSKKVPGLIFDKNAIHIHPDDPHRLLDNSKKYNNRIVNYLMCRSLILSNKVLSMENSSYGLSYSNAVSSIFPSYLILSDSVMNINDSFEKQKRRNKVLIYYGKVRYGLSFKKLKEIVSQFDEYEIIHREYPSSTTDLYNKISESSLLISLDPLTSLIHESTLIGTPVYVYDDVFKEYYDNFDFKLHGLYYNLKKSDLKKVFKDSENLSEKTIKIATNFMSDIDNRTEETINNIENHFFNNLSNKKSIHDSIKSDIEFLNKKWGTPAIFNCITFNTIQRYHLITKYKLFAIFIFFLNRIRKIIFKYPVSILIHYGRVLLTIEEKSIVRKYFGKKYSYVKYQDNEKVAQNQANEQKLAQKKICRYW